MTDIETPIDDADPVWAKLFADPTEVRRLDWGRGFIRFKAGAAVRALVTVPRVEDWLRHGNLRYPQFSVSNGGQAVPPTAYTRMVVFGTHQATGYPDPERVAARVRSGDTLVFTMPELWDEPVLRFCRELGRALAADIRTYAYLTAPDEYGSRPHRDESELFVVQAAGSKRWELYDVPAGGDWSIGPMADPGEPREVLELSAGEALYLPLGMGHRARAGSAGSLHLTISAAVPALRDVVRTWAAEIAGSLSRNARLPIQPEHRRAALRDVLRTLATEADRADAAALLATVTPRHAEPTDLYLLPGRSPTDLPGRSLAGLPGRSPTDLPGRSPTDLSGRSLTDVPSRSPTDLPGRSLTDPRI